MGILNFKYLNDSLSIILNLLIIRLKSRWIVLLLPILKNNTHFYFGFSQKFLLCKLNLCFLQYFSSY